MLTEEHIRSYLQDILRAHRECIEEMLIAERLALKVSCKGCLYCKSGQRHREVLQKTYVKLLLLAGSLRQGETAARSFPKKMFPGMTLYRGFITDLGEYVDMFNTEHEKYRKEYADVCGTERAYRMITVHAMGTKTQVMFFDRKHAPTDSQYATIRDLMVDAEGGLCFRFGFDTKHPCST